MRSTLSLLSCALVLLASSALADDDSAVAVLTDANFEDTVSGDVWFVKFFAPWCGHCKKMAGAWETLAKDLKGKANIAEVDCTENKDTCSKYGVKGYPTIKLVRDKEESDSFSGQRTVGGFATFLKQKGVIAEDVEVSEAAPAKKTKEDKPQEKKAGDVVVLTEDNFDDTTAKGAWFVKFFAPWCGHCKKMAPAWNELATKLKGKANIAEVDCTSAGTLCSDKGVRGYPTIQLLQDGKETKYQGGRDVASLEKFLVSNGVLGGDTGKADDKQEAAGNLVALTSDSFESSVSDGKAWFVKYFAPWCGHCKKMAGTWNELADEINTNNDLPVTIAEVDCTQHGDVCKAQGVKGYPTLIMRKPDGSDVKYSGPRNADGFKKFIETNTKPAGHDEL